MTYDEGKELFIKIIAGTALFFGALGFLAGSFFVLLFELTFIIFYALGYYVPLLLPRIVPMMVPWGVP